MDRTDLVVVGGGPGGYVAAIRAAQLGLAVTLVERRATLGGTCLNEGCIPSKALLESSRAFADAQNALGAHGVRVSGVELDLPALLARKARIVSTLTGGISGLMKKNKVRVVTGTGRLAAPDQVRVSAPGGEETLEARHVLLATGSAPVELGGLAFDGARIVTSTEALAFETVPRHLVVVGAGAVGLELGLVWRRLGAEVTVVELMPQIVPSADLLLARTLMRVLREQGISFKLKSRVTAAEPDSEGLRVTVVGEKETEQLRCDKLLVAVGRKPYFEGLGLAEIGVALDERGRVAVDRDLRTNVPSISAIGDLVRGPMLAHKAEHEGIAVAERLGGLPGHMDYDRIPAVVYTAPELAQVGLTEEQAEAAGHKVRVGKFFFRANARALCAEEAEGLVKIVADEKTDRLLGAHILGPHASELIAEAVLAMEYKASAEDLASTIHAHPTLAEAVHEAALAVAGRAIHA